MRRIYAVLGISGVGKTSLLNGLQKQISFIHLQASELVKEEIALTNKIKLTPEQLRTMSIIDNQTLLLNSFKKRTLALDGLVILDGHSVVDTPNGLVEIPTSVFAEMNINRLIVLHDLPSEIANRRRADQHRKRPTRTADELAYQQSQSLIAASKVALALRCPLTLLTGNHQNELKAILNS